MPVRRMRGPAAATVSNMSDPSKSLSGVPYSEVRMNERGGEVFLVWDTHLFKAVRRVKQRPDFDRMSSIDKWMDGILVPGSTQEIQLGEIARANIKLFRQCHKNWQMKEIEKG